jgi:hypothetical protein
MLVEATTLQTGCDCPAEPYEAAHNKTEAKKYLIANDLLFPLKLGRL